MNKIIIYIWEDFFMFFIMNKGKIVSALVALTMVLMLFLLANSFRANIVKTAHTSANLTNENIIDINNIHNEN